MIKLWCSIPSIIALLDSGEASVALSSDINNEKIEELAR